MISFLGLGDLMGEVKTEAETASDATDDCLELLSQYTISEHITEYYEDFSSVQLSLNSLNDKMKEAKRNSDIEEIECTLDKILSELQDYNTLLEQFLKEAR
jgi:hypothetical protein